MSAVFISGSMNIKNLDANVKKRINNIIASNFRIILGDADGVDSSIQKYLQEQGASQVTIYCSGPQPRNNIGGWSVKRVDTNHAPGTRAFFTAKDIQLADDADYGMMIWDTKSTGTLSNVIELLSRKKKSVVYVNKVKEFLNILNVNDLEKLISHMSEAALIKADSKIGLKRKIESLKYEQTSLF
ncbi:MAG TPA: hypothetical protein PKC28_09605 [Bdellovibrionales bacterium]|nr:hypothetical protein [Bdellovibrionales bacterium]